MRYPKDHKQNTRQRLVEQCGSHAKQHGFDASGMAALAAAAGLTTGALYKHFEGKSGLLKEVVAAELERTASLYGNAGDDASRALAGYLSLAHVRHPEQGCPLPALTPEIARADPEVRAVFQAGVQALHERLQASTRSAADAWTLMAQNVGAVMLARALSDEGLQRELLRAVRQAGERLVDGPAQDEG